jgi:mannose/fructose/N-acetylgalactosamine-specific phosphotransferase system component IID
MEAVRRHIGYFNANPILASYILGAVVNMERRRRGGEDIDGAHIDRIKNTLSAVLTAKGDYFFSMVLLPLGLTIACIFAMYSSYLGPIIFLALYNYYHLQARIGGYFIGLRLGEGLGREYIKHIFRGQGFLGGCAAFGAGLFTALVLVRASSYGGLRISGWGVAAIIAFLLLRRKMPMVWSVIILFVTSAAYLLII